jgi:pilus assembly protein CpaF
LNSGKVSDSTLASGSKNNADDSTSTRVKAQNSGFRFGQLQPLLDDSSIEEIWINSPNRIFFAKSGRSYLAPIIMSAQEIRDVTERMLAWSGRRVDLSQPFVDARLPTGARLHVVIPDITSEFWALNIRKRALPAFELTDLVAADALSQDVADLIRQFVETGANILVSGATQAGKTTVLNCILSALPSGSRLLTLEEVFELTPRVADHVALQTRQASLDGVGEVSLRTLIRESLRMRPSNLVIGEVRGAEALDLLLALNSGIPGMASIHSNSALDALRKLSALPLLAGANIHRDFANEAVQSNIDVVVHCQQDRSGHRRVYEVVLVNKLAKSNQLIVETIARWQGSAYLINIVDCDNAPNFSWLPLFLQALKKREISQKEQRGMGAN